MMDSLFIGTTVVWISGVIGMTVVPIASIVVATKGDGGVRVLRLTTAKDMRRRGLGLKSHPKLRKTNPGQVGLGSVGLSQLGRVNSAGSSRPYI